MAENKFPNFDEKYYLHIQKAQQNSSRISAEIHIQIHHNAKSQTPREKPWKQQKKNDFRYKEHQKDEQLKAPQKQ